MGHDIPRLGSFVPSPSSVGLPFFKVIISVYLNSLYEYNKPNSAIKAKTKSMVESHIVFALVCHWYTNRPL